jgi:hypothetical protein
LTDYWDIIARYVPSNDLCSAALVCSRWHATFVPHLWGNPASHFGRENDQVYVALTKFKRTLQTTRLLVRSLTHTLHLPPAHAELYNGPHADWLRDTLERLPNLQSLIVRGLPFFDHAALQALKFSKPKQVDHDPPPGVIELPGSNGFSFETVSSTPASFVLRLLDASRCSNVTASGLCQALSRFENLLYLDLSFTYPARDAAVLSSFRRLSGLQVLKLRGVSLTDTGLEALAQAIGLKVRSLDIRDNQITDRGVRTLLDGCFITSAPAASGLRSPSLLPYLGDEMLEIYQDEDFEGYLRNAFTESFVSRLAIEDVPEGGITHLYVAGNAITAEGASGLIRSSRLHVLDLGDVANELTQYPSVSGRGRSNGPHAMPGVEKLIPLLSKEASDALTFLRIDHAIVTKDAPDCHQDELVQGRVELGDTELPPLNSPVELDGTSTQPEAFELPTVHTPRHELPGDPMNFIVSPPINDPQHVGNEEEEPTSPRRGSALAPECVDTLPPYTEQMALLSPISALGESTMASDITLTMPSTPTAGSAQIEQLDGAAPALRPRSYSSVATERRARLSAHRFGRHNLHPAMLPHVSTLVLTDVPCISRTKEEADRLITFIKQCAEERSLAKTQADLDYALPPGRKGHATAIKHSVHKIFALKRLVLEMAPEPDSRKASKASPWQHTITKSMTEDKDSEVLWSAAETDFSFFGDDEESKFPSLEPGRFAHSFTSGEKEVSFSNGFQSPTRPAASKAPPEPSFDTVALLSAFRKERKIAHQRQSTARSGDAETEDYWDGVVQVIRPSNIGRNDEEMDYYGNRFVDGWLYR